MTNDQLSSVIPDQVLLQTAINSLGADKGSISIKKLANFIKSQESNDGGLTRSSSTEDYPPSDSVNDSYQEHWSDSQLQSDEDLIAIEDSDIIKLSNRQHGPRSRQRMRRHRVECEKSDAEDYNGNENNIQLMQRVQELEETEQALRNQLEQKSAENFKLRQQIHELDEGLREAESERDSALRKTKQHEFENVVKLEREKKTQEDDWRSARAQLENERDELKTELYKLRHKCDRQRSEIADMTDKIQEHQQRSVVQLEKYQLLTEQSGNEREYMNQQTLIAQKINAEQLREIEELRQQTSLMKIPLGSENVILLQEENERLSEMVEDLNLQLLNQHVSRARALSEQRELDQSLADEEPVEVVQEKYKKLQDTHKDLRMYLERILDNIMERDPTLLEIPATK